MENWNNIRPNVYVPTVVLLYSVWFTAKITALHLSAFLQNLSNFGLVYFS